MDEMVLDERPGLLGRLRNVFSRPVEEEGYAEPHPTRAAHDARAQYRYTVTVRRQVTSFDDAMAAANGLKRGEQQILNLTGTDPLTRQKIVDFMCGVNFAQEGTWEEVGEHIYLIAPNSAYIEVAPPSPRVTALRN